MLKQTIIDLARHLQNVTHLYPLMNDELTIEFKTEKDQCYWEINQYKIKNYDDFEGKPMISILGNEEELMKVLLGYEGLQALSKRNQLKVSGRFKHILRIESILYCGYNQLQASM